MLSMLALLVAAQLSPVEMLNVVDGTLVVKKDAASIEGTFEVTTCGLKECHTDTVEGTFDLDLGQERLSRLGEGSVPVVGGWIEAGPDGYVTEAELDVDGGAMDEGLSELPTLTTDDEYGIMIYIIYIGDDDDE